MIDNETLSIHWEAGQFSAYAPRSPETIVLSLPADAVRSGQPLTVGRFVVSVDAGSVSMSGALLSGGAEEADVRSLTSHTLSIVLQGGAWLPTVGLDGEATTALIAGLRSAQGEPGGWNAAVQPLLTSAELSRLDDSTVELTIPQRAGYDIASPETLSLTVPPSATYAAQALAAPELLRLTAEGGVGTLSGTLCEDRQDRAVRVQVAAAGTFPTLASILTSYPAPSSLTLSTHP